MPLIAKIQKPGGKGSGLLNVHIYSYIMHVVKDAKPLLICPGIAKKRGLRCSGNRNMVGSTLFVRNSDWLNGTLPGLCIAFGGSNTDVQPNDLLPILPQTHEDSVCKRSCAKKTSLKKLARKMMRIQATRRGYCGGYIFKAQHVGAFETKKCIDKMYKLRERTLGKSDSEKMRAFWPHDHRYRDERNNPRCCGGV